MENKIDDSIRAFPRPSTYADANEDVVRCCDEQEGMTLRDYFAAAALTGMLAARSPEFMELQPKYAAADAYKHADAMIAARNK